MFERFLLLIAIFGHIPDLYGQSLPQDRAIVAAEIVEGLTIVVALESDGLNPQLYCASIPEQRNAFANLVAGAWSPCSEGVDPAFIVIDIESYGEGTDRLEVVVAGIGSPPSYFSQQVGQVWTGRFLGSTNPAEVDTVYSLAEGNIGAFAAVAEGSRFWQGGPPAHLFSHSTIDPIADEQYQSLSLQFDKFSPTLVYIITDDGRFISSYEWTTWIDGSPPGYSRINGPRSITDLSSGYVLIGVSDGILLTPDLGSTWENYSEGLPVQFPGSRLQPIFSQDNGRLYVAVNGAGLWSTMNARSIPYTQTSLLTGSVELVFEVEGELLVLFEGGSVYSLSGSAVDVAITGVNGENPDEFAFVALSDLPAFTPIYFSDNGWQADGTFRSNEQVYEFTPGDLIPAGTVTVINANQGSPLFAVAGDQLSAFRGTEDDPYFLHAVHFATSDWDSDATNAQESALPTGLVNGLTATAIGHCPNSRYTGPSIGTAFEIKRMISDAANWTCGDRSDLSGSFRILSTSGNAPVFTGPEQSITAYTGAEVTLVFAAVDPDGGSVSYTLVSGPSGGIFEPTSGTYSWTPTDSDLGTVEVIVEAFDGVESATRTVTVEVLSGALVRAPIFTAEPQSGVVQVGVNYLTSFVASDPEGGSLSFTIDGAAFSGGVVSLTPAQPGIYPVAVTATDEEGYSTTARIYVTAQGELHPGIGGDELGTLIDQEYSPASTLGYDVARDTMYATIDLGGGVVCGVYSGFCAELTVGDPSTVMFNSGINAEHVWPQSMGASEEPQKSDLHHLFPAKDNINSTRSNHPYAEIPDNEVARWFRGDVSQTTIPSSDIGSYSEYSNGRFEPRESVKGDVARAALYFALVYPEFADQAFLDQQLDVLLAWNDLDPVSAEEGRRSYLISQHQGNINPLIVDPSGALRRFRSATTSESLDLPAEFGITALYPNPASESLTIALHGPPSTVATLTLYDSLGRVAKRTGASVGQNKIPIQDLSSGIYHLVIEAGGQVLRQPITVLK